MPKAKSAPKAAKVAKAAKAVKPAATRLKRKAAATAPMPYMNRATKDPNKPKRPPSAFFIFMSEFRELFKKENPNNKSVIVGKAAGSKWKSMFVAEKAPYVEKAEENKLEYGRKIRDYYNALGGGQNPSDGESDKSESDKSKSEVNDMDEEQG